MSYRFMRIIVFFDLPTVTAADRHNYGVFRRMLIKNGFMMLQESVYCRMVLNTTAEHTVIEIIKRNKPESGLVQILTVTEKQYSKMEFITGEFESSVLNSDERLVIL